MSSPIHAVAAAGTFVPDGNPASSLDTVNEKVHADSANPTTRTGFSAASDDVHVSSRGYDTTSGAPSLARALAAHVALMLTFTTLPAAGSCFTVMNASGSFAAPT